MNIEFLKHKDGTKFVPITSPEAVIDSEGKSLATNLAKKVDKIEGKGLSTNDYTTAEKTKLAGIAEGATVGATTEQAAAITDLAQKVGTMANLQTTAKSDLVSAINEVKSSGGSSIEVVTSTETSAGTADEPLTIQPNKFYVWGEVTALYLSLGTATAVDEFMVQFSSGSTAPTIALPNTLKWADELSVVANKTYQISIKNGLAVYAEF